ncbi:MAG TPA: thioesterase family protein [Chloroflexia bacterium]|nr:thioesterase family protein [Chloroflexia bacterium]
MFHRYTAHFRVRTHDIDSWSGISAQRLAAYLEQSAWEASDDAGFGDKWYRELNAAWVIHRLTLARLGPIRYQDDLSVDTWISSMGRVRSSRDYEMRGPGGTPVAAGRADWVFVDRVTGRPKGIDRRIVDTFETGAQAALLVGPPLAEAPPSPGRVFVANQRAYRYETDSMGHINNTIYLAWLDEALAEALATAGLPLAPPAGTGLRLEGTWYVVDYLRSALAGDHLEVQSHLTGIGAGGTLLEWTQEITRGPEAEVLVRCVSRQQICGLDGRDPATVVQALLAPAP